MEEIEEFNNAIDLENIEAEIDQGVPVELKMGDMSISGLITIEFNQDLAIPELFKGRRLELGSDI
jgi:hypothetical protein